MLNRYSKLLIFLGLMMMAMLERLWWDLGPNVELIMLASVLASIYLGRKWGVGLAIMTLAVSDLVIGNTMIMVFTWSAFAIIAFGGSLMKKWQGIRRGLVAGGYGLISALGFYFYTNFGVWLITPMYEKNLIGLIKCYEMGLPFLRIHAMSSGLFLSGGVVVVELLIKLISLRKSGIRLNSGAVPQL